MRERRIENEWQLLRCAAAEAPERLSLLERLEDCFRFLLLETPCLRTQPEVITSGWQAYQRTEQSVCLRFPRFYPAMPVEIFIEEPVFHPNAHPQTGFLCIWSTHRVANTVLGACQQTAAVLRWQLINEDDEHLMQPEALLWKNRLSLEQREWLPLHAAPLGFAALGAQLLPEAPPVWRRRLTPC